MRSTKGTAKHFVVLARVTDTGALNEVQRFEYQEGSQFLTRKAAFRHADTARMRWQNNYWGFRDATMVLTDTADLPLPAPLVRLRHHVTGAIVRGEKQAIPEKIDYLAYVPGRQ